MSRPIYPLATPSLPDHFSWIPAAQADGHHRGLRPGDLGIFWSAWHGFWSVFAEPDGDHYQLVKDDRTIETLRTWQQRGFHSARLDNSHELHRAFVPFNADDSERAAATLQMKDAALIFYAKPDRLALVFPEPQPGHDIFERIPEIQAMLQRYGIATRLL